MKKNYSKLIVTAQTTGGLGNQLFQIANVLAYAWKYSLTPIFKKVLISKSTSISRDVYWNNVFKKLLLTEQSETDYDQKLISFFEEKFSKYELKFIIISNDPEWTKNHMKTKIPKLN